MDKRETVSVTRSFAMNRDDCGALIGVKGDLIGKYVRFQAGETMTLGKDASRCNVVFSDSRVSRVHCEVTYDGNRKRYVVTDQSSNGIMTDSNEKLEKGKPTEILPGTHLMIGSVDNEIVLG